MTISFEQFALFADAVNLSPGAYDARPYGGWSPLRDAIDRVDEMVMERQLDGDEPDAADVAAEAFETSVVVAVDAEGRIRGGWSVTDWFLGNRCFAVDEVAKALGA